jgi:hypothetical protein
MEVIGETLSADACFQESVRVFEAAGMDSERARALYDWGQSANDAGDLEAGQRRVDEARAIFERLGMTFERDAAARPA